MATLNISLTPELASLVHEKVSSGLYHSASEVVRDGLRLLKERDDVHKTRLERLTYEVGIGTAQLDAGHTTMYATGGELAATLKEAGRSRVPRRKRGGA